jgi:hypothetical protein
MLAGVQTIEIGDAINTQQDSLAIEAPSGLPPQVYKTRGLGGVVGYAASCMHTCPAKPLVVTLRR